MDIQRAMKRQTVQNLARLLITKRWIRGHVLRALEKKLYEELILENLDDRPRLAQREKYDLIVGLLHGLDRAIERRIISRKVLDNAVKILVDGVILSGGRGKVAPSLGSVPPLFLLISPTGKCNLRCTGCYAASDPGNHASLDFETFDRILTEKRELWGSRFTVLSGGEPLLWRDGKIGLLDVVEKHNSDIFMMYTNATLITEEVARRMAELGNIIPAISVEGFRAETDGRRGKGVHERILTAFGLLRKHGVPFGISVTPTSRNWKLVSSDEFAEFYFTREGATFGWMFQYMPIGRGQSLDLMVGPEDRVELKRRVDRLVRERKIFLADFWNHGGASNGCISAGRPGGYFYIDWNGDISPCAFVPYAVDNINDIYAAGKTINAALESPFFRKIRVWQAEYGYEQPVRKVGNWFCPCVIRDHFELLKAIVKKTDARPVNEEARAAIRDEGYFDGMKDYGRKMKELTDPEWEAQFDELSGDSKASGF